MYPTKAIVTRYLEPTTHRGSRVVARSDDKKRVVTHWDYSLDVNLNHIRAAEALVRKLKWIRSEDNFEELFAFGSMGPGFVFVRLPPKRKSDARIN